MKKYIQNEIDKAIIRLPCLSREEIGQWNKVINMTIVFVDDNGIQHKEVIEFITQDVLEFEMPFYTRKYVPRWFLSYDSFVKLDAL